jgi:hypothetical protein
MVYLRIAFADEKTYSDQLLLAFLHAVEQTAARA